MSIGSSISAFVALAVALTLWRLQALGKRRMEVAEEALFAFQKALDAIGRVRAPLIMTYEHLAAAEFYGVEEHKKAGLDYGVTSYHVVVHRLFLEKDAFDGLRPIAIRCRYFFGPDVEKSFDQIRICHNQIAQTAQTAVSRSSRSSYDEAERERVDQIVIDQQRADDAVRKALGAALETVEKACGRHLRDQAAFWPFALTPREIGASLLGRAQVARWRPRAALFRTPENER